MQRDVKEERVRQCGFPSPVGDALILGRCIEACLVREACKIFRILVSVEQGKGPKLRTCHGKSMHELGNFLQTPG